MGFVQTCLVGPFLQDSGYTICNSIILFTGLALLLVFAIPALFRKYSIQCDRHFITGATLYAILGSLLRVLDDAAIVPPPYFVSPAIWLIGIAIASITLFLSLYIAHRSHYYYHTLWQGTGVVLILSTLAILPFSQLGRIFIILLITALWAIPLALLYWQKLWQFQWPAITLPLAAHLLDATSTVITLQYFGGEEKHVLPAALITATNMPAIMFPLKLGVVLPALLLIDRYIPEERRYYMMVIGLLGLIPAVRNIVRLLNGV